MAGKKRKSPKSSPSKASATATQIQRREEAAAARAASGGRRQLWAVILFAIALFLLFVVLIKGQNVWSALHFFLFGVFGVCAYIWPVLLGFIAVLCAMDQQVGRVGNKVWESGVLIVLAGAAVDIFSQHPEGESFGAHLAAAYQSGMQIKGGGFLGGLIGYPVHALFGQIGAAITIILLIFVFFMLITGTTLLTLFRLFSKPVKSIERQAEEAYTMRLERQEQRRREQESAAAVTADGRGTPRFNVDIPLGDESPEPAAPLPEEDIKEKQKRVIDTYRQMDREEAAAISKKGRPSSRTAVKPAENQLFLDESVLDKFKAPPEEKQSAPQKETEKLAGNFQPPASSGITVDVAPESYRYPPISLLSKPAPDRTADISAELEATAARLVDTLRSFGVETRIVDISRGPSVTRYELQPSAGVKISKITNLADDIALNLATAGVRIEAPIPNKAAVGIEVPNKINSIVCAREIIGSPQFTSAKSKLSAALGKDIAGNVTIGDIAKMPHGLIAGATGSGKSVCINSIIISLLYKATPDEVKLLMIDPKVVELGVYNGIPHLLVPVVTDPRKAAGALGWAVTEMEKRYKLFAENNVRDLSGYNRLAAGSDTLIPMPHIVIVIDELADLMMTAPNDVEDAICRIAQKARAAGMHLIIATQRPSVDVITGIIKANIPTRIAFSVSSQVDSRTILDMGGAEKLMGRGDMLFYPVGSVKPRRVQGCFVSDAEVEAVVEYVKSGGMSDYDEEIMEEIERQAVAEKSSKNKGGEDGEEAADPMLKAAIECVVDAGQASTSLLQRRLKLGYARAARIIDEMETRGIVGPYEGSKPRQVIISKQQFLEMQAAGLDE